MTPKLEDMVPSPVHMDVDQENKPLIGQTLVNGILPSIDGLKKNATFQPIKSEAEETR